MQYSQDLRCQHGPFSFVGDPDRRRRSPSSLLISSPPGSPAKQNLSLHHLPARGKFKRVANLISHQLRRPCNSFAPLPFPSRSAPTLEKKDGRTKNRASAFGQRKYCNLDCFCIYSEPKKERERERERQIHPCLKPGPDARRDFLMRSTRKPARISFSPPPFPPILPFFPSLPCPEIEMSVFLGCAAL